MEKIKVIQIGIGHDHAIDVLDSMVSMKDVFEVVALAVPESEKKDFSDKIDICINKIGIKLISVSEALNLSVRGAIIETEEENLCKYAYMAAEKGLHIHMDKPGCMKYAEFEKLVALVKKKNLVFSIGYMYRFNPVIRSMEKSIKEGKFGNIYSIEAQMNCEHNFKKKRWLSEFPGGMMFFLGCHLIDLIYRVQGEPIDVIPLNTSTDKNSFDAEDFGMAIFKYHNGVSFVKVCASEPGGFMRRQIVFCGDKGTAEIRPIEKWLSNNIFSYTGCSERKNMCSFVREIHELDNWNSDAEFIKSEKFNRYDDMMKNYAKKVNGEKEYVYTYEYELNLFKLILKACGENMK